jgi:hypothetical protein
MIRINIIVLQTQDELTDCANCLAVSNVNDDDKDNAANLFYGCL